MFPHPRRQRRTRGPFGKKPAMLLPCFGLYTWGNCNCSLSRCREAMRRLGAPVTVGTDCNECRGSVSSTSALTITVPVSSTSTELPFDRELRELCEGLKKAFAWRHARTREGWLRVLMTGQHLRQQQRDGVPRPSPIPKDFQRRPGRPSRFRGHGGPCPVQRESRIRQELRCQ